RALTRHSRIRIALMLAGVAVSALGSACEDSKFRWPWDEPGSGEEPEPALLSEVDPDSLSLRGTVRSYAYIEGLRKLRVRGFGLVGGLANTGGKDCPDQIRRYLQKEVLRESTAQHLDLDPKEILNDPRFVPVVVTAEAPAAAMKGDRFDLIVRALGSETTSLEGGYLFQCTLKLFSSTPRGVIEGRSIAQAQGSTYVSSFGRDDTSATKTDPRTARVLGGGRLNEDRRLRLVLRAPSYAMAARIRNRLNSRYGGKESVADAVSPTTIRLTIPTDYRDEASHFIALVLHTALDSSPQALQRRAADLAEEAIHPLAPYEDIALTWEAIGRSVLPVVRSLYTHRQEAAAYYAGRTGLRLGDDLALEVVGRHAATADSPFREEAVRELTRARRFHRALDRLEALLSTDDNRIRILAYEGLVEARHRSVESALIGDRSFMLDVLDSGGEPLVYVRQSDEPRIALFGRGMRLRPPALYTHREAWLTINANAGDEFATAIRRNPIYDRNSDPIRIPLDVARLIRRIGGSPGSEGLGLDYSVVVDVLYQFTQSRAIPATLILERPRLSQAVGRMVTRERPESEF
ncbi:MAG: flagellar basal body P-ring protein FlgI, partial [Phycisphaerae bacterium]